MDTSIEDKATAFRLLHERPDGFIIPNPWDAGTARILAGLGFQALATTSGGLAYSLGRRDAQGLVTREEALQHARVIVEATPLPVSGDLENGFGDDPQAAAETIRGAGEAGLVGGSIEDATTRPEEPVYPLAQAVERVRAAVEAARSLPFAFTLTARAENYLYGRRDLADTIARLQAFEAAGADVLYAPGLRRLEDIQAVCKAVSRPVNVLALRGGPSVAELVAAGARRVSLGSNLARTALAALVRGATELRQHGTLDFLDDVAAAGDLDQYMLGRQPPPEHHHR